MPAAESCTLAAVTSTARRRPHRVGDDAPLPSDILLPGIDALAGGEHAGGGFHALRVDHAGRRFGLPSFLLPQELAEQAIELGEHTFLLPPGEVAVDRVPVREVMREVAPLKPGAVHVQNRVHDVAQVVLGRSAEVQSAAAALETPGCLNRLAQLPASIG